MELSACEVSIIYVNSSRPILHFGGARPLLGCPAAGRKVVGPTQLGGVREMSRDCSKVTAVVDSAEETHGGPWAAYPCHVLRIVITADYGRTPRGMLLWGSLNASPVNCKGASPPSLLSMLM